MNAASANLGIRMKNPAHPGTFVRHEIIEPPGLSVKDAASVLGVTRPALSALLNERAALSPEMALRIERALWRLHGHIDAYAEQLRHRPGSQTRGGNQG